MATIPDDFVRALGRVTANFAQLELITGTMMGSLVSCQQPVGQILAAHLPFQRTIAITEALFRALHPDDADIEALTQLLQRAALAEQTRNRLIHSAWVVIEEGGTISVARIKFSAKGKQGLKVAHDTVTAVELNATADEIAAVCQDMIRFFTNLAKTGRASLPVHES